MLTRVKDMLRPSPKPSVGPEDAEPLLGEIDELSRENREERKQPVSAEPRGFPERHFVIFDTLPRSEDVPGLC